MLPQDTHLGRLTLLETFDYYDMPLLFTCYSENLRNTYLAVLCEQNELLDGWLYVRVSPTRLRALKNNQISVSHAFTYAEDGYVHLVCVSKNNNPTQISRLDAKQISYDRLPDPSVYLMGKDEEEPSDTPIPQYKFDLFNHAYRRGYNVLFWIFTSLSVRDFTIDGKFPYMAFIWAAIALWFEKSIIDDRRQLYTEQEKEKNNE